MKIQTGRSKVALVTLTVALGLIAAWIANWQLTGDVSDTTTRVSLPGSSALNGARPEDELDDLQGISGDALPEMGWSGFVVDENDVGVAGATLSVSGRQTKSGIEGQFFLTGIRRGAKPLTVTHPRFIDLREPNPLLADGRRVVLMASGTINGRIERDLPVSRVGLWQGQGRAFDRTPLVQVEVLPDGSFRVEDLDPGTYGVGAIHSESSGSTSSSMITAFVPGVRVSSGETADVTLKAEMTSTVRGRVINEETGRPVVGAKLAATPRISGLSEGLQSSLLRSTVSAADGSFAIDQVPFGRYRITVTSPWNTTIYEEHTLWLNNRFETKTIRLAPLVRIAGTVLGVEGGVPSAPCTVRLFGVSNRHQHFDQTHSESILSGADGSFAFDSVPGDFSYIIVAENPDGGNGGEALLGSTATPWEEALDLDVSLRPVPMLRGQVVDQDGSDIPDAQITLEFTTTGHLKSGASKHGMWQKEMEREIFAPLLTTRSNTNGQFTIPRFVRPESGAPFIVQVWGTKPGFLPGLSARRPGEAGASTEDLTVILERKIPSFQLRLVDAKGAAAAKVALNFNSANGPKARLKNGGWESTTTDASGVAKITGRGTHFLVRVTDPAWMLTDGESELVFPIDSPSPKEIEVLRRDRLNLVSVLARVEDAITGAPVPGLMVRGTRGGVVSTDWNDIRIDDMLAGRAKLWFKAPGYQIKRLPARRFDPGIPVHLGTLRMERLCRGTVLITGYESESDLAIGSPISGASLEREERDGKKSRYGIPLRVESLDPTVVKGAVDAPMGMWTLKLAPGYSQDVLADKTRNVVRVKHSAVRDQ